MSPAPAFHNGLSVDRTECLNRFVASQGTTPDRDSDQPGNKSPTLVLVAERETHCGVVPPFCIRIFCRAQGTSQGYSV